MYEQAGKADRKGTMKFIVMWLHRTTAASWRLCVSCECFFPDLQLMTKLKNIWTQNKVHLEICLRNHVRAFDCLEIKMMFLRLGNDPNYLNRSLFFHFPSGKDEAKTASSQRLYWKTTTLRSRTPSTRAGTWHSHARAVRGRPPRPSSTRGRPTSWSVYPGGTCWVRGDHLMSFLSLSPCNLSASGLNTHITSAQGAAKVRNHWGRTGWTSTEKPL